MTGSSGCVELVLGLTCTPPRNRDAKNLRDPWCCSSECVELVLVVTSTVVITTEKTGK